MGESQQKNPWLWGGLAAFVMYNLVFWDLIPTMVAHKYYCDTQAGFWVYKTPEQWMKENPGQAEGLFEDRSIPNEKQGKKGDSVDIYHTNKRFNFVVMVHPVNSWLPVYSYSEEIIDSKNNQTMNRLLGFWAGYPNYASLNYLKLWLGQSNCGVARFSALSIPAQSDFINIGKRVTK